MAIPKPKKSPVAFLTFSLKDVPVKKEVRLKLTIAVVFESKPKSRVKFCKPLEITPDIKDSPATDKTMPTFPEKLPPLVRACIVALLKTPANSRDFK